VNDTSKQADTQANNLKSNDHDRNIPLSAHILWIGVSISLIVALYFAYGETTSKSALDMVLPRVNITVAHFPNGTIATTQPNVESIPYLPVPQVPRFIIIWGYIGAAAYLLKVVTGYLGSKKYEKEYLPYHVSRLFIGPALAAVVYFILETGSFFGLSFDVTKVSIPLLPYLYAGVAFLTGYFVRPIIETLSKIINGIFNLDQPKNKPAEDTSSQRP
jgi:hypothetical protein